MMTAFQLRAALKELERCGLGLVYEGYSGRMMFGSRCLGFVTDEPEEVAGQIRDAGRERFDDMGKSRIVYWPAVEV
jgi:hypothetical protein